MNRRKFLKSLPGIVPAVFLASKGFETFQDLIDYDKAQESIPSIILNHAKPEDVITVVRQSKTVVPFTQQMILEEPKVLTYEVKIGDSWIND